MKVTFYGSIALAAIAADQTNAAFTYEEADDFAQSGADLAIRAEVDTEVETNALATNASDVYSEGELDSWSDADSLSDSDLNAELDADLDGDMDSASEDDGLCQVADDDLAQLDTEANVECRWRWRRRRAGILAARRRLALLRAQRIRKIRAAQCKARKMCAARKAA